MEEDFVKKIKGGWTVTSFIGILVVACALTGSCQAASYESMKSYEDLLRSQTLLIGSFENLLKNTTLSGTNYNYQYQFLDSFDDLAMREQLGLNSFEDLVSYNWSTLSVEQRISLTQSFEDLIRREAMVLSSNEDLLKRGYCNVSPSEKRELLDRFEARLKYEVVLYTKFEDWLHFQQTIENSPALKQTWIDFLDSFEDLIRRQARLLESFEMLLKIRCDSIYLNLTKTTSGNNYSYTVTAGPGVNVANVSINDSLMGFVAQGITLNSSQPFVTVTKGPLPTTCADCNNCTCNVCNFATACGDVVTPTGNFTVCVVSNQVCRVVVDGGAPIVYPGIGINDPTAEGTVLIPGGSPQEVSGSAQDSTCAACSRR
jgi:hypothetical protein